MRTRGGAQGAAPGSAEPTDETQPEEPAVATPPGPAVAAPPIERALKTSERIAAALVADIVAQRLKPGDRLSNEAAMVERFQVGRGSLREALRILEVQGLISLRSGPGGGPVIVAVQPRDIARAFSLYLHLSGATIRELTEARLVLEPMTVRLAATTRDPDDMARLREAVDYEASVPTGDPRYLAAGNNFHYVLATMTGNRVLDLLATSLKELYGTRVVQPGFVNDLDQDELRTQHRQLAEAILRGDANEATRLAREHAEHHMVKIDGIPGYAESVITWG